MPHNPHDPNAIEVRLPPSLSAHDENEHGGRLGFLPQQVACWVTALMHARGDDRGEEGEGEPPLHFGVRVKPGDVFSVRARLGVEVLLVHVGVAEGHPCHQATSSNRISCVAKRSAPQYLSCWRTSLVHLLASVHRVRPLGLSRLRNLLAPHQWPRADRQKAFWYTSSSLGNFMTTSGRRFLSTYVTPMKLARHAGPL